MSGICGIINLDGTPVDSGLLREMTEVAACRGPDGIHYWVEEGVGFAHLALHTTLEAKREHQPLVDTDRCLVLVADARIDNRSELIRTLKAKGFLPEKSLTDADLILMAYKCWGRNCPQYLLGDFCFALWDQNERALLLTRDQLGARPCYYHQSGRTIVFASEVQQILQFPGQDTVHPLILRHPECSQYPLFSYRVPYSLSNKFSYLFSLNFFIPDGI